MYRFVVKIKEVGNPTILTSSVTCDGMTMEELVKFWGLNEPDVEWYRLYEIVNGQMVELTS